MRGMGVRAGLMAAATALMLGGCAVTMPPEYLGIPTRAPIPEPERARIAALAAGKIAWDPLGKGCPWPGGEGTRLTTVACDIVPASQLAGLAWSGNKPAALELGKRFEAGRGVPQDFGKALLLYSTAGATTGGDIWYYSPGVGGQPGQVMPLHLPQDPGLAEAQRRRALLAAWQEKQANPDAPPCPAPPIALASLAAQPEAAPERARLDAALAAGKLGRGECLWPGEARRLTTIPCDDLPLAALARMAAGGDRRAMLELGIRFERGRGVAANRAQAEALYCAAGETRITAGGYAQGPGGSWTPLSGEIGLPEARRRWERLRAAK